MMKFIVIAFVFVGYAVFAQQILEKETVDSKIFLLDNSQIKLTSSSFSIKSSDDNIFAEEIEGLKIFKASPEKQYFFIANFKFPSGKNSYPISIYVFKATGELQFNFEIEAYYDLPHPIFSINDQGILGWIDLLSLKVEIFDGKLLRSFTLEKDPEFEIERSGYFEMTDNSAFILATLKPAAVDKGEQFSRLYKLDISTGRIEQTEPDMASITLLKNIDGNVAASGVKFSGVTPIQTTIVYDENLLIKKEIGSAMEQLIKIVDKYYSKFSNTVSVFSSTFEKLGEYSFNSGERIKEIAAREGDLAAAVESEDENFLYIFDEKLSVESKVGLNIFGLNQIEGLQSSENKLIIRMTNNSIILN